MGLCIAVRSESGEQLDFIADEKNLLDTIIGDPEPHSFPMLASIDRYGDTTFNRNQLDMFLSEWESLFSNTRDREEILLLEKIKQMAISATQGVHQYLVFIGD
jgi:hypothetical protein